METFMNTGFVVINNVVPKSLCEIALRKINRSLGSAVGKSEEEFQKFNRITWCPELTFQPCILNLLYKSYVGL